MLNQNKQAQKNNRKKRKLGTLLIFLVGLLVFAYPFISRFYYRVEANQQVADFEVEKAKLNEGEIKERMDLAHAFNESLSGQAPEDPYDEKRQQAGRAEYARMLELNEKIGHIQIPVLDLDIPIYAGTAEEILQKGAGHLEGTSLPVGGNSTHSVITAHSGLPTARLFSDLSKLEIGDRFYIHNLAEILAYQVDQIKVIEPSNFQDLLIVEGHDYVTLLTCTPIMINTHRLLVRAHRVPYTEADHQFVKDNERVYLYLYIFYALLALAALLLYLIHKNRKKAKGLAKEIQALQAQEKNQPLENPEPEKTNPDERKPEERKPEERKD